MIQTKPNRTKPSLAEANRTEPNKSNRIEPNQTRATRQRFIFCSISYETVADYEANRTTKTQTLLLYTAEMTQL